VHCELEVLEQREGQRGDRALGLARKQFELVHQDAFYDVEINTSTMDLPDCLEQIVTVMKNPENLRAFRKMHQEFSMYPLK
jgi:chloramphenicol 3-O phosphotransferase